MRGKKNSVLISSDSDWVSLRYNIPYFERYPDVYADIAVAIWIYLNVMVRWMNTHRLNFFWLFFHIYSTKLVWMQKWVYEIFCMVHTTVV